MVNKVQTVFFLADACIFERKRLYFEGRSLKIGEAFRSERGFDPIEILRAPISERTGVRDLK